MADIFPSVVGGALGRMVGSAFDSTPSQSGGLPSAPPPVRDDVKPLAMPDSPEAARQDLYKEMNSLRRVQNDLLRSLEDRSAPNARDTLYAISRGLLAPNPTGQFGAAFGNAVGELQGQRTQQDAAAQQLAKMRLEMGQSGVSMAEKGIALAQEQQRLRALQGMRNKVPPGAPAGTPPGAVVTPPERVAVAGAAPGTAPAAANTQAMQAAASQAGLNLPDAVWNLLEGMDSKEAIAKLTTFALDQAKTPDTIKAAEAWISMLPPAEQASARRYLAERNIEGEPKLSPVYVRELGGTFDLSARELHNYITAGAVPPRLTGRPAAPSGGPAAPQPATGQGATTSSATPAFRTPPSQEQLSAEKAGVESEARTRGTEAGKALAAMMQRANLADSQITLAERVHKGAESFPDAFGVLSKAGLFPALIQLARDSKVPFIPKLPPNIEARIVQAAPIPRLANETDAAYTDRRNRRIEALLMAGADIANLELGQAQTQRGLGALTDFERKIISQSIVSTSDPARVLQAKAALQKATAQLNQETRNAYQAWANQPANRMKSFYDFESSAAAKQVIDTHNARAKAIYEMYFPAPAAAAAPAAPAAAPRAGSLVDQFRASER